MKKNNTIIVVIAGILTAFISITAVALLLSGEKKGVYINEVCCKNEHIFADGNGGYYDYIELYNASGKAVDLTGYGLSDKEDEPYRYTFSDTTIKPGEYMVILATKEQTDSVSTGFGLDADEENRVFLSDAQGRLIDEMEIPILNMDVAYGRSEDGGQVLDMLMPSPYVSNQITGTYAAVEKPAFSMPSGFYDNQIQLEITCSDTNAKIYYTLDGSVPGTNSMLYQEPLTLEDVSESPNVYSARTDVCTSTTYVPKEPVRKANIVRAVAYDEAGHCSAITSGTFFIGLDQKKLYGDAPVISLISAPENFFDAEKGIYVLGKTYDDWMNENPENAQKADWERKGNFSNTGDKWERDVCFEYITPDGKAALSQDMGIRIKGNTTRTYYQKSFKLISRKNYGSKTLVYDLIPDNTRSDGKGLVSEYKSFVLRNGGNDNEYVKYRDSFTQTLVQNRNFETQQSIPCVVFLDGEYWGLYTLMEDYSDAYFATNYDIDKKNVIVVKTGEVDEGKAEDMVLFEEMYHFITQNDMTLENNYKKAKEYLDIESFIEYCSLQFYINNRDGINSNHNWGMWRVRDTVENVPNADGKWRMYIFDTEYSAGVYAKGDTYDEDNITSVFETLNKADPYDMRLLLQSLYQNEEFKAELINTVCDMRNYDFEKNHVLEVEQEMGDAYESLAVDSIYRNGPDWVVKWQDPAAYYKEKREELKKYYSERYDCYIDIVSEALHAGESGELTLEVSDVAAGTVIINHTQLDFSRIQDGTFVGTYFKDYPVNITAIPQEGFHFVGWEIDGGSVSDANRESAQLAIDEACKVTAVFEKDL